MGALPSMWFVRLSPSGVVKVMSTLRAPHCSDRAVPQHQQEYASLTAASAAVARKLGVGGESVRRWVLQAQVDACSTSTGCAG